VVREVGSVVVEHDSTTRSADTSETTPATCRPRDVTGVDSRTALHAGADERRVAAEQRHSLTLHVGTHEGAVGVVVLEERDQRGRDRHHLARRDVHVVDVLGRNMSTSPLPLGGPGRGLDEATLGIERGVGLRDDEVDLVVEAVR
jgi:hypothetical protein